MYFIFESKDSIPSFSSFFFANLSCLEFIFNFFPPFLRCFVYCCCFCLLVRNETITNRIIKKNKITEHIEQFVYCKMNWEKEGTNFFFLFLLLFIFWFFYIIFNIYVILIVFNLSISLLILLSNFKKIFEKNQLIFPSLDFLLLLLLLYLLLASSSSFSLSFLISLILQLHL